MQNKELALLFVVLSTIGFLYTQVEYSNPQNTVQLYQAHFNLWLHEQGKKFESEEQYVYRLSIFADNYQKIEQFNQENENVKMKINQFADLDDQEFRSLYLNTNREQPKTKLTTKKPTKISSDLPKAWTWQNTGAVLDARNQGSCGSCWAFSTVGGLQGLQYIVTGVSEYLSVQQVTSCVPAEYLDNKVEGCGGGLPEYAYQYTAEKGIETEEDYPYQNFNGGEAVKCQYNEKLVAFKNQGLGEVPENDVNGMMENVHNQPLSIGIDAGSLLFRFYESGVIPYSSCQFDINHSILLVGYNTTSTKDGDYFIVQNSWGTSWGNNGFANMEMHDGKGTCAMNMQVNYPTSINQ